MLEGVVAVGSIGSELTWPTCLLVRGRRASRGRLYRNRAHTQPPAPLATDCAVTSPVRGGVSAASEIPAVTKTQPVRPNWTGLNCQPSGSIPVSATNLMRSGPEDQIVRDGPKQPRGAERDRRTEPGEKSARSSALPCVDALLRSNHELRAAVRLAGQKIVKLNFGRRDDPVLDFPAADTERSPHHRESRAGAAETELGGHLPTAAKGATLTSAVRVSKGLRMRGRWCPITAAVSQLK